MGIFRVIDNQSTAQAITILILEMAVVPERPLQNTIDEGPESVVTLVSYRLVERFKLVEETVSWNDGALGNECGAIDVIGMLLEKAVPVLWKESQSQ